MLVNSQEVVKNILIGEKILIARTRDRGQGSDWELLTRVFAGGRSAWFAASPKF